PDWDSIMPSIFWSPYQNIRIGVMETFYTRIGGTTSSLITYNNGLPGTLSPHDFNTTMLYGSIIY
ncbi:MAG: hypothetical protein KGI88_07325, partial [Betaproteobacteria bacterium]|nr:hypothetical protein [Betaproteobacteria bacterium]